MSPVRYRDVEARLDPNARPAFAESRPNLAQVAVKVGEMNKHLAEAAALAEAGFREDAHNRYDAALLAAAAALMALTGARLSNAYKGRKHWASIHFLAAALTAHGQPAPTVEALETVTRIRSWVDYDASMLIEQLTPQRTDEARQACDLVRRSVLALVPPSLVIPTFPTQRAEPRDS